MEKLLNRINELKSEADASRRNLLALDLAETRDERVLDALIELINRSDLADYRATLVHCLRLFNYAEHFELLIGLVISGNWEVAHEAFELINSIEEINNDRVAAGYSALSRTKISFMEDWRSNLIEDLLSMFE